MTEGRGKGKKKYVSGGYTSKRQVGGPGIFITTIRGKESRCVQEFYNLLDEVADRLYPKERLAELEKLRPAKAAATTSDAPGLMNQDATEAPIKPEEEQQEDPQAEKETEEDQSIEAQIAREIAALNPRKTKKSKKSLSSQSTSTKGGTGKKKRARFLSAETGTECGQSFFPTRSTPTRQRRAHERVADLSPDSMRVRTVCFFSIAWPYDPVELCKGIVDDLQSTKVLKTRFCLRLTPVSISCHAMKTETVLEQSKELIRRTFKEFSASKQISDFTFAIEPSIRSHSEPITRSWLIEGFGHLVNDVASSESLQIKANLSNPDLVLLPVVLMKEYALGIVEGKGWVGEGKKWNMDAIGAEINKKLLSGDKADGAVEVINRSTGGAAAV
ncbi:BQ2448_7366 [Microbotryum intermedium]|uniref:BQ2448_7366 protein n=1 Tax=Microbotryum intermedium TaxID=269621 RepID=A0A238FI16_9BASI|nr:BQ2448_7366 [Microbotryum intermedium]